MNPQRHTTDFIISIALIVLAILFLDPFMLWMPSIAAYCLAVLLVLCFAIFAGLLWRERAHDEREQLHKMIAGRLGYLTGTSILVIGLVYQTIYSHPDPWLVIALVGMIIGKMVGLWYSRTRM